MSSSIKAKLIMAIVALVFVALSVLGIANYWNANKMLTARIESNLMRSAENNADRISNWLDEHKNYVTLIGHAPTVNGWEMDKALSYMSSELKRNPVYLRQLMIDSKGEATYSDGKKTSLAERDYFKQAVTGKVVIGDPVLSKADKVNIIVAAAPIVKNGAINGVFAATIKLDSVIKLVSEIKASKTGYAYVIQKDGLIIFHPQQEMAMKVNLLKDEKVSASLKEATAKMVKGETGLARYSFNGDDKFIAYRPIPGTSWSLAINVPVDEVNEDLNKLKWTSVIIAVIVLGVSVMVAIWVASGITRPLNLMKNMIQDIAHGEGDLTKRLDESSQDELGETARYFNQFIGKLHSLIGQISQTTVQLATASSQLHSTAEQMATGAEEVAAQAATVATAGEEMSATSGDIAQNCSMAAEGSRQASDAAVSGARVVDETITVMNSISEKVRETAKTVESLGSRSEQIGDIVGTIQDIADQTNLLALNAAIEAARAGEQGRGFAVVADEVRALAERTTRATKEISEMIRAIQGETKGAVAAMEAGVDEVEKGGQKAADSGRALESILSQINEVTMQINQVATAAEEQTATTSEISNNMHQITDVVSNTSRGAQETSQAAIRLSELSEELRSVVSQFKL